MKTKLLIIDPQNDFMDTDQAALPVAGAKADMKRLANTLNKAGGNIKEVYVTLDSHNKMQIFHPCFWQDAKGNEVAPFTTISHEDIKNRVYTPNYKAFKDNKDHKTIYDYCLAYTKHLEAQGLYSLTIWPYHCLVGSYGHLIEDEIFKSLLNWEEKNLKPVNYIFKGNNAITEHYGALKAEYEVENDPNTSLNTNLLQELFDTDKLLIAGQASSHCIASTLKQIVANVDKKDLSKIYLLTDCTSPVLSPNNEPDFAKITDDYFNELKEQGVNLVKSGDFLG